MENSNSTEFYGSLTIPTRLSTFIALQPSSGPVSVRILLQQSYKQNCILFLNSKPCSQSSEKRVLGSRSGFANGCCPVLSSAEDPCDSASICEQKYLVPLQDTGLKSLAKVEVKPRKKERKKKERKKENQFKRKIILGIRILEFLGSLLTFTPFKAGYKLSCIVTRYP